MLQGNETSVCFSMRALFAQTLPFVHWVGFLTPAAAAAVGSPAACLPAAASPDAATPAAAASAQPAAPGTHLHPTWPGSTSRPVAASRYIQNVVHMSFLSLHFCHCVACLHHTLRNVL